MHKLAENAHTAGKLMVDQSSNQLETLTGFHGDWA